MNVTLRLVELEDAVYVQQYASDARVAVTTFVPHPYPAGAGESWARMVIARREQGISCVFSIWAEERFAGIVSLNGLNGEERSAEMDYWIAVPYWNRGIGTEATKQAIGYAAGPLRLTTLRSACLARNAGSSRVLLKNGFRQIGEFTFPEGKFAGERGYRYELNL